MPVERKKEVQLAVDAKLSFEVVCVVRNMVSATFIRNRTNH